MRSCLILLWLCLPVMGSLEIIQENDVFLGDDDQYTQGLEIIWRRPQRFRGGNPSSDSWSIRNTMYTPTDLSQIDPQPDDRPWAGYTAIAWERRYSDTQGFGRNSIMVGVTGKASSSAFVQDWFHENVRGETPMGWHNQIPTELFVNYRRETGFNWKRHEVSGVPVYGIDLIGGYDFGTAFVNAYGGASLKLGYNIPQGWGLQTIGPTADYSLRNKRLYLTADYFVRGVLHNILLGGSFFRDGESRDMEYIVDEIRLGGGGEVDIGEFAIFLRVAYVSRGREFVGQERRSRFVSINTGIGRRF